MISHPEKVLFPDDGITKGELAAYYEAVAPIMLPHIVGRPVTMERYPSGIGKTGFMQKSVTKGFPSWLQRIEVPKKDGTTHYPLAQDEQSLLWMANQNCITPHVWTSRLPELFYPDLCVFDLDPSEDDAAVLRKAALGLRDLLEELGLQSWVKTTGSKGYHIVVPLDGKAIYDEVWRFTYDVALAMISRDPENLTLEFSKADRGRRIFVDVGRNGFGATFAAPYAVRPKPGAPVSAPCTWEELESGNAAPQAFTLRKMASRIDAAGELWADMLQRGYSLEEPRARLEPLTAGAEVHEPKTNRLTALRLGAREKKNDKQVEEK